MYDPGGSSSFCSTNEVQGFVISRAEITSHHLGSLRNREGESLALENGVSTPTRMSDISHSTNPCYVLTVQDARVQVVYGVKWCGHLRNNHMRLVVLVGDRRQVGQAIREPGLVTSLYAEDNQQETFGGRVQVSTRALEEIEEDGNAAPCVPSDEEIGGSPHLARHGGVPQSGPPVPSRDARAGGNEGSTRDHCTRSSLLLTTIAEELPG